LELSLLGEFGQRNLAPEDRRLFCGRFLLETFPELMSNGIYDLSSGWSSIKEQARLAEAIDNISGSKRGKS